MLSIDLKQEPEDSFSLDGSFTYSPAGVSFSSASSHGPFTPTSGRSTPASQGSSVHFDQSFTSDDLSPFDLTPHSSHGSVDSYFQMAKSCPGMDMDVDILTPNMMPATPTRFDSMLDHAVASQNCFDTIQMTPQQPLDNWSALADSLVSPPFMFPTPEQQNAMPTHSLVVPMVDNSDRWSTTGEVDDYTIDFFPVNPVVPSNSHNRPGNPRRTSGNLLSPPPSFNFNSNPAIAPVSRRLFVADAQQKTNTLQKHLNQQRNPYAVGFPPLRSQAIPRSSKPSSSAASKQRRQVLKHANISVTARPRFHCEHPGCEGKSYMRMEHLKRHFLTKHDPNAVVHTCEICHKPFVARKDNLMSHMDLHKPRPEGSGRTETDPRATQLIEAARATIRPRKNKGVAGKKRAVASESAAVEAARLSLAAGL